MFLFLCLLLVLFVCTPRRGKNTTITVLPLLGRHVLFQCFLCLILRVWCECTPRHGGSTIFLPIIENTKQSQKSIPWAPKVFRMFFGAISHPLASILDASDIWGRTPVTFGNPFGKLCQPFQLCLVVLGAFFEILQEDISNNGRPKTSWPEILRNSLCKHYVFKHDFLKYYLFKHSFLKHYFFEDDIFQYYLL